MVYNKLKMSYFQKCFTKELIVLITDITFIFISQTFIYNPFPLTSRRIYNFWTLEYVHSECRYEVSRLHQAENGRRGQDLFL